MATLKLKDISDRDEARFWQKVNVLGPDDCWEWRAYRSKSQYGQFKIAGVAVKATHIALLTAGFDRPDEAHNALHSCDNPPCCNPAHLRWGTQADNIADALDRGRWVVQRGGDNWKTKLTPDAVRQIRETEGGCVSVAKMFGISPSHVNNIRKRRVWDHV